jgi:hypothetical protein
MDIFTYKFDENALLIKKHKAYTDESISKDFMTCNNDGSITITREDDNLAIQHFLGELAAKTQKAKADYKHYDKILNKFVVKCSTANEEIIQSKD